jgi:cell division protein FtsL
MKLINLLPKRRQQELRYERVFRGLLIVLWLSAASFILVIGVQLAAKIYLQAEVAKVAADIQNLKSQVSKSENEQLKKKITSINNYIADFKNLSTIPKWSKALIAFSALPPEEVGITAFNLDIKTKAVRIQGFAPTREVVDEFHDSILADTKEFTGVDYPLENVAKAKDNNLHFTFFVKDELVQ